MTADHGAVLEPMTPVQVVGIGLDGLEGLSAMALNRLRQADVIVGSDRQLEMCAAMAAEFWPLGNGQRAIARIQERLSQSDPGSMVVLASGDPLFFGLGRLLLEALPADQISFHPHLSSVQLAFSRLKLPWQEAKLVSIHGRDPDQLLRVLRQNPPLVAVLTDPHHSPGAIAQILIDLDLPQPYTLWVCEALGSEAEKVHRLSPAEARDRRFDPLSVVVLQRQKEDVLPAHVPLLGLPDSAFLSFSDRPGLI
ncbi:precorrin-6y C5,15-methyltransferase (decarboxylating) subunit CbiE, partial [filamentous cyanobacterium CCP5]